VPSGLGLLFTDWRLDHALLWSGAIETAPISPRLVQTGSQLCSEERRAASCRR
jgi:hypothetical protein